MWLAAMILLDVILLLVLYAIWGRAWAKRQPWLQPLFAWIEPIELALWKKSETILMGRLLWVGGLLVTAYDALAIFVQSLDLTPLTTRMFDALHVPLDMRGLIFTAAFAIIGRIITWLRGRTTKPLELVAVPEAAITPEAAQAIEVAEAAKADAVAEVEHAKAVG